jgi:hypothetical protein
MARLLQYGDLWMVSCGMVLRDLREEMVAWCHESWGNAWGYVGNTRDNTEFYFYRLSHAEFFYLKFGDRLGRFT